MSESIKSKPGFKFLWSHQGMVHRLAVRLVNKVLALIPFKLKYLVALQMKKTQVPYSLVEGKTVVQIGAPYDTLNAGRSRGMMFSLMAGTGGRVLIIEPLKESVVEFRNRLSELNIENTTVVQAGAWSKKTESVINVDVDHPATNFTGGTVDYAEERVSEFSQVKIQLDTVDNILLNSGLDHVDLISITTNWAEEEILIGMSELIEQGLEYICLAYGKGGESYESKMFELGYDVFSHDDRGVTYRRINSA